MQSSNLTQTRVNGSTIRGQVGRTVRLVGKVIQMPQNGFAVVEASDKVPVNVRVSGNFNSEWQTSTVEVLGNVMSADGKVFVQEVNCCSFGSNFDMENYQQLMMLTQKYHELFC